ncbi:MAG: hypothetical protein K2W82_12880 [Candidatus Obscuribacterales bacterium]|nr:hypothetical protein [Candidatus Obscuribacterales bacterium]
MEHGVFLSSSKFHKIVGVAQSSALQIFRKIAIVVENNMDESASVASALFAVVFCKRSRETPARAHPRDEQSELEKGLLTASEDLQKPICRKMQAHTEFEKTDGKKFDLSSFTGCEKEIFDLLGPNPVSLDFLSERLQISIGKILAGITMLELSGLIESSPGNQYVRAFEQGKVENPRSRSEHDGAYSCRTEKKDYMMNSGEDLNSVISCSVSFIRNYFHGISRRYLQNYLAIYWYSVNRVRWQRGLLLKICLRSSGDLFKLSEYVSSLQVKVLATMRV